MVPVPQLETELFMQGQGCHAVQQDRCEFCHHKSLAYSPRMHIFFAAPVRCGWQLHAAQPMAADGLGPPTALVLSKRGLWR